jgi:hypothetical protein
MTAIAHIGGTDRVTGEGLGIDTTENDRRDEEEAVTVTTVTGEMTPEIGIEDAARTLLTRTRTIEAMTTETGQVVEAAQNPVP